MSILVEEATPATASSGRRRTLITVGVALGLVAAIATSGTLASGPAAVTNLSERNLTPSLDHIFGTDRYGRDVFLRTLVGLRLSLLVGLVAALLSGGIALVMAMIAVLGGRTGAAVVRWLVDLFLALPHLVLLILIAFALGGGTVAVVLAIGTTHWPRLTRVLVSVARESVASDYVAIARALGRTRREIAFGHVAGHLVPQLLVGVVLMFPHAILHEAALAFLGIGVDPGLPAIGILLQESMRYLSAGHWWLAVFPGLGLFIVVRLVDRIGEGTRMLLDPRSANL